MPSAEEFLTQGQPAATPMSAEDFLSQGQASGYAEDAGKSAAAAFSKGVAGAAVDPLGFLASFPRALAQGVTRPVGVGYQAISEPLGLPEMSPEVAHALTYPLGGDPESKQEQLKAAIVNKIIPAAVQQVTGMDMNYQPQTKAGEYGASVSGALPYMAQGLPPVNAIAMGLGSQAGKDVTGLFTDNPKYQEAGGVVGGGLAGLAAPKVAAGMKDLLADTSTSGTSLLGLPKGTTSPNEPVDVSPQQMKELAQPIYKSLETSGGLMGQVSWDKAVDDALSKAGDQTIKGKAPPGANYVIEAQDYLKDLKGSPTSLQDLDKVDGFLRDKIGQAFRGGLNKQATDLMAMRDTLRAASKNIAAPDIVNPQAFSEWQRADKIWSGYRTAKDIQDGIANAEYADVPSTAIKNFFKTFVKNEDNLAPLNDNEIAAAKHAAQYGIVTGALKAVSGRLTAGIAGGVAGAATGALGGGPLGAAIGGPAGMIAAKAVSAPLGALANSRQAARGKNVIQTIAERPEIQAAARAARGLPNAILPTVAAPLMPAIPAMGAALQAQQRLKSSGARVPAAEQVGLPQQPALPASPGPQTNAAPDISGFSEAESGNNPNAKSQTSTASGLYGFTNRTWADMIMRYGKQTGLTLQDKNDPRAQAMMASLLAKDNIKELTPILGRMPSKGELYMAHFLGAKGAATLLNADPQKEAIMLFPRQVFDANRSVFFNGKQPRTVGEVRQLLNDKVA